jgi:hypothetical protein
VLDGHLLVAEPDGDLAPGESLLGVDPPVLDASVARGVEPADEHGGEERAPEVGGMVADHPHRAEDLRGAAPPVLPLLVRLVPLGVVALQPQVMLGHQIRPGLGLGEEVVGEPALEVEVGLDETLPGLPALDLQLLYAERGIDGLRPVGAENAAPVGDDGRR